MSQPQPQPQPHRPHEHHHHHHHKPEPPAIQGSPRRCVCAHCNCTNNALAAHQPPSPSPTSTPTQPHDPHLQHLCLICARAEQGGKNAPAYRGCRCVCRCRLPRSPDAPLCADCGEQNGLDPRRHRVHGFARGRGSRTGLEKAVKGKGEKTMGRHGETWIEKKGGGKWY
ncbi:hypothetical protein F4779DRAFT_198545 [Xylariaceae sp. FL0662B]|nr:hypothetical protein F4779DRAFT_198545 [Xylariaceae sp. FL0662B]